MYQKELLKGNTETLLLALLVQEPMYGYQIVKEMEQRSSGYFLFREGTLYPALHRLEKARLINGAWAPSPNGQQRRYYSVSELGMRELRRKAAEWRDFTQAVNLVMQPSR
ncbi:MAG: helix-turn-helix transcriptional regulator [Chloroflexi bacterium]|nr:helix-turn-helix transcriptional regulator [Chloroflexota bacterium]